MMQVHYNMIVQETGNGVATEISDPVQKQQQKSGIFPPILK